MLNSLGEISLPTNTMLLTTNLMLKSQLPIYLTVTMIHLARPAESPERAASQATAASQANPERVAVREERAAAREK